VSTGASYRCGDSGGGGVAALYVTRLRRNRVKSMLKGSTLKLMRREGYNHRVDWFPADCGGGPSGDLLRTSLQRATHPSQMDIPGP
jgi:hypothetical protein